MRTTLNLDDQLYKAAKVKATREGKTVTSVIQEALRSFLNSPKKSGVPFKLKWVTQKGKVMPGANPDDRDALYDLMDGIR